MPKLHHFVLTLSGSSEPITTDKSLTGSSIRLQAGAGNSNEVYVGGYSDVSKHQVASSTDYAVRIPAPNAAGDPAPPLPYDPWNKGIQLRLADIYVIGTAADTLAISYWTS